MSLIDENVIRFKPRERRLLISFSGGETSAYMTWWILQNWEHLYDEIVIVFANTGQENEQTLEFVDKCDRLLFAPLGYRVTYIEAVQIHGQRKSATFRIVTFETCDRTGQVFEDMIRKYGIPNNRFKHCTRDLKLTPIHAWSASIGWERGTYDTAIGIRADEVDRISSEAKANRIVYPLVRARPMTKPHINGWWRFQSFRLDLKGYQGNCRWCWKKSRRKHLTLLLEDPSQFDFPERMEALYGRHGAEFRRAEVDPDYILEPGYRRTFFRGGISTIALRQVLDETDLNTFTPAEDDAVVFDADLDVGGGCEESCEVFSDEDMAWEDDRELIVLPLDVSTHPILWFAIAV